MRHFALLVICVLFFFSGIACERKGTGNAPQAASPAPGATAEAPAAADSKVAEILRLTQETYSAATSYRDTGVETGYLTKPPAETKILSERHFETRILAPTTFRVDIRDSAQATGADIYWNGGEPAGKAKRFAASTRQVYDAPSEYVLPTNYQSVTVVPRLMLPFLLIGFSKPVTQMKEASLEGEEPVDGHQCWVVTGENDGSEKTLWIDQQSHVIRKVRRRSLKRHATDESAPSSETIITYNPELNPPLSDEDLRYVPPAET